MNARLFAIAAALVFLAGCSTKAGQDPTTGFAGSSEQRIVEEETGTATGSVTYRPPPGQEPVTDGVGTIRGLVLDYLGTRLPGAGVSLLGSEVYTTANATGGFLIEGVPAGEHKLRVVHSPYRPHEAPVEVVAGKVTEVTITLAPQEDVGAGYLPHYHDFWREDTEVVLVDHDYDWGSKRAIHNSAAGEAISEYYEPNNVNWWFEFFLPDDREDGRPALVFPATHSLKVTLTWNAQQVTADKFVVQSVSANATPWVVSQLTELTLANGEQGTIVLKPGDHDNGHQRFSLWEFRMRPQHRDVPPVTIQGPIHVKVVAVKGELGVDPPHEDFWGPNTTYVVRSIETAGPGNTICCTDYHQKFAMDTKRLVPPGTHKLLVKFTYASNRAPGTPADFDWNLYYKPSNLPDRDTPLSEYKAMTPTSSPAGTKLYELPVKPDETDAFYQKKSNWYFTIRANPQDAPEALQEYEHTFRLEVVAVKDPAST